MTTVAISPTLGDIATVSLAKKDDVTNAVPSNISFQLLLFIFDIGTQSCVLYMWTINGNLVNKYKSDVQIMCLCYTSAPEGVYVNVIVGGMANGSIK